MNEKTINQQMYAKEAQVEIDRLREALQVIVDIDDYGNANPQTMGRIAFKALKNKEE